ncbi:MAG TPA: hypothetical protein PKA64_16630, partial [Myxococcota bacterium]|nr:hypothetical protein [Myxococcota bacterium]
AGAGHQRPLGVASGDGGVGTSRLFTAPERPPEHIRLERLRVGSPGGARPSITDLRGLRSATLEGLAPWTILTGPNGKNAAIDRLTQNRGPTGAPGGACPERATPS